MLPVRKISQIPQIYFKFIAIIIFIKTWILFFFKGYTIFLKDYL